MWDKILKTNTRGFRDLSSDDILSVLGLARRTTPLESATSTGLAFVAGLAAGAGIALLLAPKSGREVRQDISNRAQELSGRIGATASELAAEARGLISSESRTPESRVQQPEATQTRSLSGTTGTNRTS
jgi:hypothetical protein